MDFRLLVDLDVVASLDSMPKKIRIRLIDHFGSLGIIVVLRLKSLSSLAESS